MADRQGKTISFYTDQETAEWLEKKAAEDNRSVSNYITLILKDFKARKLETVIVTTDHANAES